MSTHKDIGVSTVSSREILDEVLRLGAKIDSIERAARMPNIPPSTMATALLLTGVTTRRKIAELLGVSTRWIEKGEPFAAFRLAESSLRSRSKTSKRGRSGSDFTQIDD